MRRAAIVFILLIQCVTIQAVEVVFRFDDFMLYSDSLQVQLLETFYKHRVPISIAVIPCSEDVLFFKEGPYLSLLKTMNSEEMAEIALHGLNHRMDGIDGEFRGLPLQKQMDMLSKGKHFLDSLFAPTVTFVPPWNNYDDNTLIVLESLGFKCISSCMTIDQPLSSKELQYFPETVEHPNELLNAINDNRHRDGIIVLMFHGYDFDKNFTISDLDKLLSCIKDLENVECLTFKMLCDRQVKSDEVRFNANIEINLLSKIMKTNQMLQTKSFAIFIRICNLLIYVLILLAIMLLGRFVFGLKRNGYEIGCGIIIIATGIVVWWHILTPLKSMMTAIAITIVYILVYLLVNRRKDDRVVIS